MSKEYVITIDENDQVIGRAEKIEAHRHGLLHRAFSIFVFRKKHNKFELLLQQRAQEKYHSAGLWTNTCCGHPRPEEEIQEAASRRLVEEFGFSTKLRHLGTIRYRAELDHDLIENELDNIYVGFDDPNTEHVNKHEIQDYHWCAVEKVKQDVNDNSMRYTAWFSEALSYILEKNVLEKHYNESKN